MAWLGWLRPLRRRPQLRLVTKADCPLCDELGEALARQSARIPFDLEAVALESDPELERAHALEVPVLFIDDRKAFFGKVDPQRLQRALLIAARQPEPRSSS